MHRVSTPIALNKNASIYCLLSLSLGAYFTAGVRLEAADGESPLSSTLDPSTVIDFESMCSYAEQAATTPFQPAPELPADLKPLDYDDYRLISYWPNEAIWRRDDTPFQLELFHRGYIFFERVGVHLLQDGAAKAVPFEPKRYEYRGKLYNKLTIPPDTGYAGVKVLGTLPSSKFMQEVASFLGASYFRCLSDRQVYGASARGLGINMGMPQPEEFPCFREFWVTKPAADENPNGEFDGPLASSELHVLAFLDSPSLTGAYEFLIEPGQETTCDIKARLFYRYAVPKLCISPMSSMWMWGQGRGSAPEGDSRPEVHDSDGLLINTQHNDGDQQLRWRSLAKQSYPSVSSQRAERLAGFGLLQRERDYARYQDDEAKYHARPNIWIEPLDESGEVTTWPAGWVELFEMPADHEGYDNIAVWYVPETHGKPGEPFDMRYRVTFGSDEPVRSPIGRAVRFQTRREGSLTYVTVRFRGRALAEAAGTLRADDPNAIVLASDQRQAGSGLPLTADVSALRGSIRQVSLSHVKGNTVMLTFAFEADGDEPAELKAILRQGEQRLTEEWSYLCPP